MKKLKHRPAKRRKKTRAEIKASRLTKADRLDDFMSEWLALSAPSDSSYMDQMMLGIDQHNVPDAEPRARDGASAILSASRGLGEKYITVVAYRADEERNGIRLMRFLCDLADKHRVKLLFNLPWGRETRALLKFGFQNHDPSRFEADGYDEQFFCFIRPPGRGPLSIVDIKLSVDFESKRKGSFSVMETYRDILEDPTVTIEKLTEHKQMLQQSFANGTVPKQAFIQNKDLLNARIRELEEDEADPDLQYILSGAA